MAAMVLELSQYFLKEENTQTAFVPSEQQLLTAQIQETKQSLLAARRTFLQCAKFSRNHNALTTAYTLHNRGHHTMWRRKYLRAACRLVESTANARRTSRDSTCDTAHDSARRK